MGEPRRPVLGIIGGMGPQAGAEFFSLLTRRCGKFAHSDQQHLSVLLVSLPSLIPDRSEWLAGRPGPNPADGIFAAAERAIAAGADRLIMPCNTAHSAPIFDPLSERLARAYPQVTLWHWVDCALAGTTAYRSVAVLTTQGSYRQQLYTRRFQKLGLRGELLQPDEEGRCAVQQAIYHPDYGLKARSETSDEALALLESAVLGLRARNPDAVLLGCTELSLAREALTAWLREQGMDAAVLDGSELVAAELIRRLR